VETPTTVVENAPDATEALTTVETPQTPVLDYRELIVRTNEELQRLGWANIEGRDHLIATYKKRSRQLLTDAELLDFLQYLEKQPTPSPVSETPPATEEEAQQPLADIGNVEASVEEAITVLPPLENAPEATELIKEGDRIHHPVFCAGTVNQIIENIAFCIFDEVTDSAGRIQRNAKRSPYVRELTPLLGFDEGEEEF
jgi:hypothetical protein